MRVMSNSHPAGGTQVQEEVPEPYKSAIFAVWGDAPTVSDSVD